MVPKYNDKYCNFILPAYISFFFLFSACIKLNSTYDVCSKSSRQYGASADGSQVDVASGSDTVTKLGCIPDDALHELPCLLHIVAGINQPGVEEKAVAVMQCLLNRYGTSDAITLALLSKNKQDETPLYIAMKKGSVGMLQLVLEYTHRYALLNPELHKDLSGKDYISIALDQYVAKLGKSNPDKLLCLLDELFICNDTEHLGSRIVSSEQGITRCRSMEILKSILHSHKNTKYPDAVLPFSVANNKVEVLKRLMDTLYSLCGNRDGDIDLLNLLTKRYFIKGFSAPILLLQVLLDKGQLNKISMGTVDCFVALLGNIDTNTLYKLRDNPKVVNRLVACLTEDVCKNMISSIDALIEEHGCADLLQVIQSMLRIFLARSYPLQLSLPEPTLGLDGG